MSASKRPGGRHFSPSNSRLKERHEAVAEERPRRASREGVAAGAEDDFQGSGDYESVGRAASLMTGLIIISRITGFARTWVMGIAFGVSFLASSYNIANNLPNMLYELVMGGMLVTAFLPVYMEARRSGGREAANA